MATGGYAISASDPITISASGAIAHLGTTGYAHVPTAGSSTQVLQWSSDGVAKWVTLSSGISVADGGAVTVLTAPSHTHATYSVLATYAQAVAGAGSTKYTGPLGGWDMSEASAGYFVVPVACTVSALYVDAQTAPGGADTSDFYIMKNGAQQTMTCQLSAAGTTANTAANPVSLAAGDKITIQSIHSATAATAAVSIGIKLTTTSAAP